MHIETANRLVDAVKIIEISRVFEAVGSIVTGIDTETGGEAARVMLDGEPLTGWISADRETVQHARDVIWQKVFDMSAAADARDAAAGAND